MMRVTNEMMVSRALSHLSARLERYERAQSEMATGKRLLALSDDPGSAARALQLRSALRSREQEMRNADDAAGWLQVADGHLQSAVERLHRARDLAVRGANGGSAAEREAIAAEVRGVAEELRAIANAQHSGRPLFAGYASPAAVVQHDGTGWVYQGDRGAISRRVGDAEVVRVNVTAEEVFGLDPSQPGAVNTFHMLDQLAADLESGNTAGVQAAIGGIDTARRQITDGQARIGTTANRVESARTRNDGAVLALRGELAEVEDADLAEAAMELQTQEVAYEATLQALARALPPSLVSFLR